MLFFEQLPNPQSCPDGHVNASSINTHETCIHTLISDILLCTEYSSEQKFASTNIWRMQMKGALKSIEADSWFLFK